MVSQVYSYSEAYNTGALKNYVCKYIPTPYPPPQTYIRSRRFITRPLWLLPHRVVKRCKSGPMPIFEWPHPKEDDSQYLRLLHKHFIRANFTLLQYLPLNQNKNISKTSWFGNDSEQTCGCCRTSFWAPITGSVLNWAWGNSVSGADDTSVGLSNSSGLFFFANNGEQIIEKRI